MLLSAGLDTVSGKTGMLNKLGMILFAAGICALLSSCLVDKKDPETINNTDTSLRTYLDLDFINYTVNINDSGGNIQSGTMQVKWDSTNAILNPITAEQYDAILKETTTLTINSDTDELVRFIEQDVNGSMYLRTFPSSAVNKYYWLSSSLNVPTGTLERFETFRSPLAMSGQIDMGDFYVFDDCNGTDCPSSGRIAHVTNRTFEVTATNETVSTGLGDFTNVYKVQYNGIINPDATAPLFDILDVCGSGGLTSHSAVLFVAPAIGIIKAINTCTDLASAGAGPIFYTIILDNTNILF